MDKAAKQIFRFSIPLVLGIVFQQLCIVRLPMGFEYSVSAIGL